MLLLGFLYDGAYYRYTSLPMGVTNGVFYFKLFSASTIEKLAKWMCETMT